MLLFSQMLLLLRTAVLLAFVRLAASEAGGGGLSRPDFRFVHAVCTFRWTVAIPFTESCAALTAAVLVLSQ